jgi:hypothetical protein
MPALIVYFSLHASEMFFQKWLISVKPNFHEAKGDNMSTSTKRTSLGVFTLLAILFCVSHQLAAQINLGGISIPKPKKVSKPDPNTTPKTSNNPSNSESAPQDVQTNPLAPADYNANLNIGDQAVAIDHFRDVTVVKIAGKSGNAYKVAELESPDSVHWYSVNSVYPYFNYQAFTKLMYDYKHYVTPYLPCYGQKHNLGETNVTTEGYNAFGARRFDSADDAQKTLEAELPKLVELDNQLKSQLGGVAPNTYLEYLSNPAIVSEIAAQRVDYLKCVVEVEDSKPNGAISLYLSDIQKAQEEAGRYSPADFLYLVSAGGPSEQLVNAVSHRARDEWSAQVFKSSKLRAQFDAEWDKLAAIAAKKIPTYKPSPGSFRFRDPAGEKQLMTGIKNPSSLKIFRVGADVAGWDIQRDGSNFPSYRYKTISVYFRNPNDDHPYCHVVSARIKQDYAGGGRYNSEIYRSSVSDEIFGCP